MSSGGLSILSLSRDDLPLTRSSPDILPSRHPLTSLAELNLLSKSQEVAHYSYDLKLKENVPPSPLLDKMVSLRKATLAVPPPLDKPKEEIAHYQSRMKKIAEATSSLLPATRACAESSQLRNRYPDVLPTDAGLVSLKFATNAATNYINASRLEEMVITQGPLATTLADFWVLALENATDIICLTNAEVNGVEKSYPYWIARNSNIVYENTIRETPLKVILLEELGVVIANSKQEKVIKRKFEITLGTEKKTVMQWHYVNWPDHGICDPISLAQLIELVLDNPYLLVHCSAGIGRSGVFVIALQCIKNYLEMSTFNEQEIDERVIQLRQIRPNSVQNFKQLKLISDTIYEFTKLG